MYSSHLGSLSGCIQFLAPRQKRPSFKSISIAVPVPSAVAPAALTVGNRLSYRPRVKCEARKNGLAAADALHPEAGGFNRRPGARLCRRPAAALGQGNALRLVEDDTAALPPTTSGCTASDGVHPQVGGGGGHLACRNANSRTTPRCTGGMVNGSRQCP